MLRISRVVCSASIALLFAVVPACQGVTLDLGTTQVDDCHEVAPNADLSGVYLGKSALVDCLRVFVQTALDLAQAATDLNAALGAACDGFAHAGGEQTSLSPDLDARCTNAILGLGSPTFVAMAPYLVRPAGPETCVSGPTVTCGACPLACQESDPAAARASCAPPPVALEPAVPPASTPSVADAAVALSALRAYVPLLLQTTSDDHFEALAEMLPRMRAQFEQLAQDPRLDARGAKCALNALVLLLLPAERELTDARQQAARVLAAVPRR